MRACAPRCLTLTCFLPAGALGNARHVDPRAGILREWRRERACQRLLGVGPQRTRALVGGPEAPLLSDSRSLEAFIRAKYERRDHVADRSASPPLPLASRARSLGCPVPAGAACAQRLRPRRFRVRRVGSPKPQPSRPLYPLRLQLLRPQLRTRTRSTRSTLHSTQVLLPLLPRPRSLQMAGQHSAT